jgi:hypothetical protein
VALVGRLVRSTLDDGLFHVPARGVAGVSIVRDDVEVEALSAGMQRLNGDYARSFNHRHNRRGHLFAGRFSSWVIEGDDYLENTSGTCCSTRFVPASAGARATGAGAPPATEKDV